MKIQFVAWHNLWGLYFDKKNRKLYILPLPMTGIVILFGRKDMKSLNFLSKEKYCHYTPINPIKYCKNGCIACVHWHI